ncbi:MAG: capsular polysaccharide synthesis protein [Candidatus Symbiothrix sp.]|nr:capsular polysaccharide synthesis protein [Candidatus Symbiothrix sp.]
MLRLRKTLCRHQEVADFWHPVINEYFQGRIEKYDLRPKKPIPDNKVIWQYWGQGFAKDNLPEIVQICFDSVDKYKGDYVLIRLSDDTVGDYIDFPDFVWEKLRNNIEFTKTFFSDLLRVALLNVYGGVWLDATVLLTAPLPPKYAEWNYFMYQRDDAEPDKKYWESMYAYYWNWKPEFKVKMLTSIFFARKGSEVIQTLLDLILYYWKTQDHILDYFFFQILYNELMESELKDARCPLVSDVLPHYLQTKVNNESYPITMDEALKKTSIHKMAYYQPEALERLKLVLDSKNIKA